MAIGERIKFIRNLRGITQKFLGQEVGFSEKTADVRMAQYELGTRTPKFDMLCDIAKVLNVQTFALDIPNFDNPFALIASLIATEDIYGFKIDKIDGELVLKLNPNNAVEQHIVDKLTSWYEISEKLKSGGTTKEEYDNWRYNYPESKDVESIWRSDEYYEKLRKEQELTDN